MKGNELRVKNVILGSAIFIFTVGASIGHFAARLEIRATDEVCQLMHDNYFRPGDADVQLFFKRCDSDSLPFTVSRALTVKHLNSRLAQIQSSHLSVYSPDENRRIWENEGSDTGLRARMIDGDVVIRQTLSESPAARARLGPGDIVVAINGEAPTSAEDVESTGGEYKIARGKEFFLVDLKLEDVKENLFPYVESDPKASLIQIRIPSFLPQYFDESVWPSLVYEIGTMKHAIIDLRGNSGGSFPAMLRALSVFRCGRESAGYIYRAKRPGDEPSIEMINDLKTEGQLDLLARTNRIQLKPFSKYPCFRGDAVVLVDSGTSSVSEIFAHAMQSRPQTKIWGWPTAGRVVVAQWFPIPSLGGDYAISIPVAGYRSDDGREIEHEGVTPSRELHYDLSSALRGEDSWITDAKQSF